MIGSRGYNFYNSFRLLCLSLEGLQQLPLVVGLGVVGGQLEKLLDLVDGCRVVPLAQVNACQQAANRRQIRVDLGGLPGCQLGGPELVFVVEIHRDVVDRRRSALVPAGDPVEQIRELTGGRGVDYSFEVIGLPVTMRQAYDCLAKRGVATLVGITPTTAEVTLPALSLVYEERTVTGSLYGSASAKTEIPRLIDLYRAGNLMLDELLTRTYPIEEINQAYADLESGETLRSVVTF